MVSVILTREVRWRTEIPKRLFVQMVSVILTHEVRWRTDIPKQLSIQTVSVILTCEVRWRAKIPKRLSVQTVFVILTREVRWHAGVPYGYPHLSSTMGKWARWRAETNVVLCTFLSSWPMKSGDMRGYHMVIRTFHQPGANEPVDAQRLTLSSAPFVIQRQRVRWQAKIPYGHPHFSSTEANEFDGIRMMLVVRFWLFSKYLQVFTLIVRRHSSPTTHKILLCWAGGDQVRWRGEMSWLSHFIAFNTLKFCRCF